MMNVAFYDEEQGQALKDAEWSFQEPPVGFYFLTCSPVIWTESTGAGMDTVSQLIINTKPRRYTFDVPRLVKMQGRFIMLSAIESGDASGTLRTLKKRYILLETQ